MGAEVTETLTVRLPLPPSLSAAYINSRAKGRIKSPEARAWSGMAFGAIGPQVRHLGKLMDQNLLKRHMAKGPKGRVSVLRLMQQNPDLSYAVTITFVFPNRARARDILNFDKLLPDFLVDAGILLDDSFVDDCRQVRGLPDVNDPHVKVEIITIDKTTPSR